MQWDSVLMSQTKICLYFDSIPAAVLSDGIERIPPDIAHLTVAC